MAFFFQSGKICNLQNTHLRLYGSKIQFFSCWIRYLLRICYSFKIQTPRGLVMNFWKFKKCKICFRIGNFFGENDSLIHRNEFDNVLLMELASKIFFSFFYWSIGHFGTKVSKIHVFSALHSSQTWDNEFVFVFNANCWKGNYNFFLENEEFQNCFCLNFSLPITVLAFIVSLYFSQQTLLLFEKKLWQ